MKRSDRIQEWLADRVSFIQYPNIHAADARTREASRSGIRFKHQMRIGKRIDILLISFVLLLVGIFGLIIAGGLVYFVLAALF